ncbi:MAG: hypothetical protein KatS3mg083_283 [Candidatus Dojkabacteria bacterium]|nr:MAG: hypothetical protein KatS3mg083_283 [Candidatus Dojkabacteria bacterium]
MGEIGNIIRKQVVKKFSDVINRIVLGEEQIGLDLKEYLITDFYHKFIELLGHGRYYYPITTLLTTAVNNVMLTIAYAFYLFKHLHDSTLNDEVIENFLTFNPGDFAIIADLASLYRYYEGNIEPYGIRDEVYKRFIEERGIKALEKEFFKYLLQISNYRGYCIGTNSVPEVYTNQYSLHNNIILRAVDIVYRGEDKLPDILKWEYSLFLERSNDEDFDGKRLTRITIPHPYSDYVYFTLNSKQDNNFEIRFASFYDEGRQVESTFSTHSTANIVKALYTTLFLFYHATDYDYNASMREIKIVTKGGASVEKMFFPHKDPLLHILGFDNKDPFCLALESFIDKGSDAFGTLLLSDVNEDESIITSLHSITRFMYEGMQQKKLPFFADNENLDIVTMPFALSLLYVICRRFVDIASYVLPSVNVSYAEERIKEIMSDTIIVGFNSKRSVSMLDFFTSLWNCRHPASAWHYLEPTCIHRYYSHIVAMANDCKDVLADYIKDSSSIDRLNKFVRALE